MSKKASLKDEVYHSILDDISASNYQPGQILNEKELVEKYKCSKSPIRDALQVLCAERVLRSIPRYGYEIIPLSTDDVHEMMHFRYILEPAILRNGFKNITSDQLTDLQHINEKMMDETNTIWERWQYNTDFHVSLVNFCGNKYAVSVLEDCVNRLKRACAQMRHLSFNPLFHAKIIENLINNDIEQAVYYLIEDLKDLGSLRSFT